MIYSGTILNVLDNSGAKKVKCIKILGKKPKLWGTIGDIIIVVVKRAKYGLKAKKSQIYKAVIVRTVKHDRRKVGNYVQFENNAVVLLNNNIAPLGSRAYGIISRKIRELKFLKVVSMTSMAI